MKYTFIHAYGAEFKVGRMCKVLEVSVSGYYAWRNRKQSARAQANQTLQHQMEASYQRSGKTYGSPRLTAALRQAGIPCNRKRVMRLMRLAGISARLPRRRVRTTVADPTAGVAPIA